MGRVVSQGLHTGRSCYHPLGLEVQGQSVVTRERQLSGKGCLTKIGMFSRGIWATHGNLAKRMGRRNALTFFLPSDFL